MKREIKKYLFDIKISINSINEFLGEKRNFFEFQENKLLRRGIEREIEIIGEAAKNVPDGIKEKYDEIPWAEMYLLRNKVSHEYFGVDLNIIKKSGSWFSYGDTKLGQGREAVKGVLKDNPEFIPIITEQEKFALELAQEAEDVIRKDLRLPQFKLRHRNEDLGAGKLRRPGTGKLRRLKKAGVDVDQS